MSRYYADGDVPTAANQNLYEGQGAHVPWHRDDEPLFGGSGDPKLIVSLCLGSPVVFKWKAKSCSDSDASSFWLHHWDLLVMDGRCHDEYLYCTSPGLADRRVNITYRWIRNHTSGCPLAAGVLGSLPTFAHGSPVLGPVFGETSVPVLVLLAFLVVLICGLLFVLSSRASCRSYHKGHIIISPQSSPWGQNWGVEIMAFWRIG